MEAKQPQVVLNQVLQLLRKRGIPVEAKPGRRPEGMPDQVALWRIGKPPTAVLAVPLTVDPGDLATVEPDCPRLWVANHITDRTARRLITEGRLFADAVGNAHLNLPGLFVQVLGNRPAVLERETEGPRPIRGWRRPALRVLFHLLCDPALARRPIRELAALGGTAPGTVVRLFGDLEQTHQLMRFNRRERRFQPDRDLEDRWIAEYGRKLRPTLLAGRFTATDPDWYRTFDPTEYNARWGAEAAAELLGADLRPALRTLYTAGPLTPLLRAARLRADPLGTVEVRHTFYVPELPTQRPDTTPTLLVIADLLATRDGRCHDAALELRKRWHDDRT